MSSREQPSPRHYRSQDRDNRTERDMHRYQERNSPYHPSYIQHDVRSEYRRKYYDRNNYRSRSRERQYDRTSQQFNNRPTEPSYNRNIRKNMPYSRNRHPSSDNYDKNYNYHNNTSRATDPRCSSISFKTTNTYSSVSKNSPVIASDPNQKTSETKILKHLVISHLLKQLIPANNITEQHFENFPLKCAEDEKSIKHSDKNVNHANNANNNNIDHDHDDGYDADSEDAFDDFFLENLYYSSKLKKEIKKYHDIKKELMEISAEIQIKKKQDREGSNIDENKICSETNASTTTSQP